MAQEEQTVAKQMQVLLGDASVRELVESLLVLACEKWHPCRESLTKIDNALRLISAFTEKIPTSSNLLKAVLQSISSNVISDMLHQYASLVQGPTRLDSAHDSTTDVCPLSYHKAQARLHQNLAVMVLESALQASQHGDHFDASIMTLLLKKQFIHFPAQPASVECTQRRPISLITPKISLFETFSTPRVDCVSLNWRDGLIREMSRDVNCQYEGVIRMVGEICRDLELRCNETERPLREEQSKSCDLQARLESSERNKAELECQARDHQLAFSALETERECLANQVVATEERLKELATNLDDIHQESDHAQIEATRAAQAAIESARQRDLAYLATMTAKDEELEEQSLKLARTETHVRTLEHELDRMRALEANNAEKLNNSEKNIERLKSACSASERRVQDLQNEVMQIKEQDARSTAKISSNEALIEELNSSIVTLKEASNQKESLISILKDQLQKAEVEASELRAALSAKDAQIENLDGSNQSLNRKWQSELEAAHKNAAAASEQSAATIADLKSKIRKLRKEREVRISEPRIYVRNRER